MVASLFCVHDYREAIDEEAVLCNVIWAEVEFKDAMQLSDLISKSNQIRSCFNKIISRSYLGRSEPKNYVEKLGFLKGPVSYQSIIEQHVSSSLFLQP